MPSFSLRTFLTSLDRKRFKRLATEGGWILAGQVATFLGALTLTRVITDYLDPASTGELALGLTITTLIAQTIMAGVTPGVTRFYSIAVEQKALPGYFKAVIQLMSYAVLSILLFSTALLVWLALTGQTHWIALTFAVLAFSVVGGFNSTLSSIQSAARQRAVVAFHSSLDAWLKIGLAILVVFAIGRTSQAFVIGYTLSALVVTSSQFFFLRHRLKLSRAEISAAEQRGWIKKIWLFSWPMLVGGLFNWAYFSSQRWALQLFASTEEVGKFYALTLIAYTPISMAAAMLMSFLTPILFARAGDPKNVERVQNVHQFVIRTTILGLCATLLAALVAFLFHRPIFSLFAAPAYQDISLYMPLIVMAAGILVVSQQLAMTILVKNETKRLLTQSLFGNGLATLLNLALTAKWGVPGLMISMVLGAFIHLTWTTVIVLRSNRERNFSDVSR